MHFSDNDMDILKSMVFMQQACPGSNSKACQRNCPTVQNAEKDVKLALGTDGPASNNCLDMFREMFLMTALQKIANKDAAAFPADKVLFAATSGSAKAMGLDDCVSISEGMQADLIVIDLNQPNMQPMNNIGKKHCIQRFKAECKANYVCWQGAV